LENQNDTVGQNDITLSVVVPVLNAADHLRQALDSVLGQSLKDFEVICVDGGSEDESQQILKEYEEKDESVHVFIQKGTKAGQARNFGLEQAKGKYIHFLDADDYLTDYAYESIVNKLNKFSLDVIRFCAIPYDVEQKTTVQIAELTLSPLGSNEFMRLIDKDEPKRLKLGTAPYAYIFRTEFLKANGIKFGDTECFSEYSFTRTALLEADNFMLFRDYAVIHRVNQKKSLSSKNRENFRDLLKAAEDVRDEFKDIDDKEEKAEILKKLQDDCIDTCKQYVLDYKYDDTTEELLSATEQFIENFDKNLMRSGTKTLNGIRATIAEDKPEETVEIKYKKRAFFRKECASPKVSVVVPSFNVELYMNQALHSLTTQTLTDIEFICVNDGSTDGTLTIMKHFASFDKRIKIIDKVNTGYGNSMNLGINQAKGKYLGILEPDDYVQPKMFKTLYDIASKNNLDFIKGDFYRFKVTESGRLEKKRNNLTNDKSFYNRLVNPSEELETMNFIMNTWSGIYKLDFLNKWGIRHNETPGASFQDNGFWFQTFIRATRAWFVDTPFYMNRRDNPNSSVYSSAKIHCMTDEYRYIEEKLKKEPGLFEKYSRIFYKKRMNNYLMTYRRLGTEDKRDYLDFMYDEYKDLKVGVDIDEESLGQVGWFYYNQIMEKKRAFADEIKVSVIIAAYNCEQYIEKTLNSVLFGREINYEVIIVNDGSTDNTLSILKEYEKNDERVRVIEQENQGAGVARNTGMKYAKGEYLLFLDADDLFELEMVRLAWERAKIMDDDILVFRSNQFIDGTDEMLPARYTIHDNLLPEEQPFAGTDIKENIFGVFVGWAWDKLFRAEFVKQNNLQFQALRTTNDMKFVFSAIAKAERISTRNEVLAHHRRAAGTLSVTREKSWNCFYQALVALRQQLKDWNLYERFEQDFINYSLHFSFWQLDTIRGASYNKLYDAIKNEYWEDLGLLDHKDEPWYFYSAELYDKMQTVLNSDSQEYLFARLEAEQQKTETQIQKAKEKINEEKAELEAENARQSNEIDRLNKKIKDIENSKRYKIGKAIVSPGSTIKKIFNGDS